VRNDLAKHKIHDQKKELESLYEDALDEIDTKEKELAAVIRIRETPQYIEIKDKKGDLSEATAFVLMSDFHIEETVNPEKVNGLNRYTLSIAEKRIKELFQNTLKLVRKEQQSAKINRLVVALLGDAISGNIHEELLENCSLRPMEAIIKAQELIYSGIRFLLENSSLELTIVCHVGNHSRTTKRTHYSTEQGNSLEYFMYHNLKNMFKDEKRVLFIIAEGYHSYLKAYDFTIRFHHGHAIKYGGGIGGIFISAYKAISQWQKSRSADLDCFGHLHQMKDGGNFLCNGSVIGYNAFSVQIKADFERPKQTFFLIDQKRGKTMVTPITFSE
jgi:hypothetical protein